jgi:hypothetical protein
MIKQVEKVEGLNIQLHGIDVAIIAALCWWEKYTDI